MKAKFGLVKVGRRGGIYYTVDRKTGHRESLRTSDKNEAIELLATKNEASREAAFNLQKARVYLAAAEPGASTRTWKIALDELIDSKPKDSENRYRWTTFAKDEAIQPLLPMIVLETRPNHLLDVLKKGTVSTNVFLRRLHNFCLGMNWLPLC